MSFPKGENVLTDIYNRFNSKLIHFSTLGMKKELQSHREDIKGMASQIQKKLKSK